MSFMRNLFTRCDSSELPLDLTEDILGRHLDRDFCVFPMAEEPSSFSDVKSLSDRLGIELPVDFCAHICGKFPGIYVEVKEEIWPRPKLHDVGPFWTFLYGLHTFTPRSESEDWMRIEHVAQSFLSTTGHKAAPILQIVGDSDIYCVTTDGGIAHYNHETNELAPQTISFWDLFDREVQALKERKRRRLADA